MDKGEHPVPAFFNDKKISELSRPQTLITVPPSLSLEKTLEVLHKNDFLSVPVVENDVYLGNPSVFDIMIYLSRHFKTQKQSEIDFQKTVNVNVPVQRLVGLSEQSGHVYMVDSTHPLVSLVEALSMGFSRAIMKKSNSCDQIITQSDLVDYLHEHMDEIGDPMNSTILDLGLVSGKVISVKEDSMMTLDAMRKMTKKDIDAIAVLDSQSRLCATLSDKDLRGMTSTSIKHVIKYPLDFLKCMYGEDIPKPVVCKPESTLAKVIDMVVEGRQTQAWVVDDARKPIGIVTLGDIISCFSPVRKS